MNSQPLRHVFGALVCATLLSACSGGAAPASSAPAPASKAAAPASAAKPAAKASAKPAASASAKPAASASAKPAASGLKAFRLAVPQGDSLTTGGLAAVALSKGFFKDEGLDVQTTSTAGGATTVQAVVSGSVDYAIGTGLFAIMTAFTKNAPVQIAASDAIGTGDLYWYAKADSPINKLEDFAGKKVAFTNRGSSSNLADEAINDMLKSKGLKPAELLPVGGFPDQLTAVKTGQIDVGLAGPPANLAAVERGEIKIVFRGSDITALQNETLRGQFVNTNYSAQNGPQVAAFIRAYNKTWKYMLANKAEAIRIWKQDAKLQDPENILMKAFDYLDEDKNTAQAVKGIDQINKQAVDYKAIEKPLTQDELNKLITTQYLPK
jgi:NitT/TauT family transport system substrate-binding protein